MTRLLIVIAALLLAMPVAAHQQKITISTVSHNPRTEMLEVVHRIPLHDAEHALEAQGMRAPDIVTDIESRRAFANYVAENFSISSRGEVIALTLLGTEIEGGNLIVLQEGTSPGPGAELLVHSQILSNIWSRQENLVNLESGTSVNTLIFRAGDPAKSAMLP
ncbi:MAG: DUF6702 family protein [Pseudomonadota bacterium]